MDRKKANKDLHLFQENNLHVIFWLLGYGTVSNEVLDYLGLESPEKASAAAAIKPKKSKNPMFRTPFLINYLR